MLSKAFVRSRFCLQCAKSTEFFPGLQKYFPLATVTRNKQDFFGILTDEDQPKTGDSEFKKVRKQDNSRVSPNTFDEQYFPEHINSPQTFSKPKEEVSTGDLHIDSQSGADGLNYFDELLLNSYGNVNTESKQRQSNLRRDGSRVKEAVGQSMIKTQPDFTEENPVVTALNVVQRLRKEQQAGKPQQSVHDAQTTEEESIKSSGKFLYSYII